MILAFQVPPLASGQGLCDIVNWKTRIIGLTLP